MYKQGTINLMCTKSTHRTEIYYFGFKRWPPKHFPLTAKISVNVKSPIHPVDHKTTLHLIKFISKTYSYIITNRLWYCILFPMATRGEAEAEAMAQASGWRRTGMFKGIGLPIPSGQYRVGCVDVMPLCPGEERGLLFRLYYPTEATPDSGYHYPPWIPNKLYAKGYLLYKTHSSMVAGALGPLLDALCGKC